jgi:DNA polymerase-3 subunit beta
MRLQKNTLQAIKTAKKFMLRRPSMPILGTFLVSEKSIICGGFQKDGFSKAMIELYTPTIISSPVCLKEVEYSEYTQYSIGDTTVKTCDSTMPCISSDEYPNLFNNDAGPVTVFPITSDEWKTITEVSTASSKDMTRFNLTYVVFEMGSHSQVVATDGHRMAIGELSCITATPSTVTIPAYVISNLKHATVTRLGVYSKEEAFVEGNLYGIPFLCKFSQLDGQFPEWRQIIPKKKSHITTVLHTDLFIGAIQRAIKNTPNDRYHTIKMTIGKDVTIETADPEIGSYCSAIPCAYTGESLTMGMNGEYLLACLNHKNESLMFETIDYLSAVIIRNIDPVKWLVMPIRLT